jgi:hypothetical protein
LRDSSCQYSKPWHSQFDFSPVSSPDNCSIPQGAKSKQKSVNEECLGDASLPENVLKRLESVLMKPGTAGYANPDSSAKFSSLGDVPREPSGSSKKFYRVTSGKTATPDDDRCDSHENTSRGDDILESAVSGDGDHDKKRQAAFQNTCGRRASLLQNILPIFVINTDRDNVTSVKVSLSGREFTRAQLDSTDLRDFVIEGRDDVDPNTRHYLETTKMADGDSGASCLLSKAKNVELVAAKLSQR